MVGFDFDGVRLDDIYARQIVGGIPLHGPERDPVLILVAGQPGAGKTRALEQVRETRGIAYAVEGDALRRFHPDYARLMRTEPLLMSDATARAAGRWVEMTLSTLREHGNSTMLETTMRHPQAVDRTLGEFRRSGYRIEIVIMATPPELSLMGTLVRYVDQVERQGRGRWVDPAAHDEAVARMPGAVAGQVAKGHVDHVDVMNRAGETLYATDATPPDLGEAIGGIRHAIGEGQRFDRITPDQRRVWDRDVKRVRAFIDAHPEDRDVEALADRIIASGRKTIQNAEGA